MDSLKLTSTPKQKLFTLNSQGSGATPLKPCKKTTRLTSPPTKPKRLHLSVSQFADADVTEDLYDEDTGSLNEGEPEEDPEESEGDEGDPDPDPEGEKVDKELEAIVCNYEITKNFLEDTVMDPLPEKLCSILSYWMWQKYSPDEIKNLQDKARCPQNAEALIPLKIEEELFMAIAQKGKTSDTPWKFVQNAMVKGMQLLAIIWSKVILALTALQCHRQSTNTVLYVSPDFTLDLQQMKAELDLGLRLLGCANSQLGRRCRLNLKHHLAEGFKCLSNPTHPMNQFMFGGNIRASIEHTLKVTKMVKDAESNFYQGYPKRPFLG